jgi:signal transduction histidine kinase
MGKAEITLFIILINIILLVFIAGIILFVLQYRKRKLIYEKEKSEIERQHKLDLLNTQLQIQQQTMQFIGQEIHDSVAQKLTLASIYTQRLEFDNVHPGINDKLSGVSKIINDSLLELRHLSKNLTDNKLQGANLQELIHIECEQVNSMGICTAVFEANEEPAINIAAKSSIFRIVQEFIQNSVKHSGCKHISIRLHFSGEGLAMVLKDDGKGFNVDKEQHNGIGLDNTRRRIQVLKGVYHFKSENDSGVELSVDIPLHTLNADI